MTRQTPNQAAGSGIAPPLFGADYSDNGAGGLPAGFNDGGTTLPAQATLQPSPYPGGVSTSSGGVPRDGSSPPWSPRGSVNLPVNQGPAVPSGTTPTSMPGPMVDPGSGTPQTLPPSGRIVVHSAPNQEPGGDPSPSAPIPTIYRPEIGPGPGRQSGYVASPMPSAPTPQRTYTVRAPVIPRPARGGLGDPS